MPGGGARSGARTGTEGAAADLHPQQTEGGGGRREGGGREGEVSI